ncbi:YhzD family protein [Massilibacterium senegalense]|uniref:YhzD family protein n=1 Tax=Massilibacterium senegalense TaxID=1632858 RepID=UPI0007816DAD|nr:YhzD family protein [Massilibacterium senegalense]
MPQFYVTAYSKKGEVLINEMFEAENEKAATEIGQQKLVSQNLSEGTSRIVTSYGRLIGFHR